MTAVQRRPVPLDRRKEWNGYQISGGPIVAAANGWINLVPLLVQQAERANIEIDERWRMPHTGYPENPLTLGDARALAAEIHGSTPEDMRQVGGWHMPRRDGYTDPGSDPPHEWERHRTRAPETGGPQEWQTTSTT